MPIRLWGVVPSMIGRGRGREYSTLWQLATVVVGRLSLLPDHCPKTVSSQQQYRFTQWPRTTCSACSWAEALLLDHRRTARPPPMSTVQQTRTTMFRKLVRTSSQCSLTQRGRSSLLVLQLPLLLLHKMAILLPTFSAYSCRLQQSHYVRKIQYSPHNLLYHPRQLALPRLPRLR